MWFSESVRFTKHRRAWGDTARLSQVLGTLKLYLHQVEGAVCIPTESVWQDLLCDCTDCSQNVELDLPSFTAGILCGPFAAVKRQQILSTLHIMLLWENPLYGYVHTAAPSGPNVIWLFKGSTNQMDHFRVLLWIRYRSDFFEMKPLSEQARVIIVRRLESKVKTSIMV